MENARNIVKNILLTILVIVWFIASVILAMSIVGIFVFIIAADEWFIFPKNLITKIE